MFRFNKIPDFLGKRESACVKGGGEKRRWTNEGHFAGETEREIWAVLPDGCSQSPPEPQKGIGAQQVLLRLQQGVIHLKAPHDSRCRQWGWLRTRSQHPGILLLEPLGCTKTGWQGAHGWVWVWGPAGHCGAQGTPGVRRARSTSPGHQLLFYELGRSLCSEAQEAPGHGGNFTVTKKASYLPNSFSCSPVFLIHKLTCTKDKPLKYLMDACTLPFSGISVTLGSVMASLQILFCCLLSGTPSPDSTPFPLPPKW